MEGNIYLTVFSLALTVISSIVLFARQLRQGKDQLSADTLKKYEQALEIRETTINDLKNELIKKDEKHLAEIKEIQAKHDLVVAGMQTQITGLQTQITTLTGKNKVLEDSVTGKVYLEQIMTILTAFQPLIAKGGILEEYSRDHKKMCLDLEDVKLKLGITNRHEDSHGTTSPGN